MIKITVFHPKTNKIVFETVTENIMDYVDTIAPYDEAGYTITFERQ